MRKHLFTPQTLLQKDALNLEELREISSGWDNRWSQLKPGKVNVKIGMFHTPRLQFSWMAYSNAVFIEGSHPPGSVALSLVWAQSAVSSHNQEIDPYEIVIHTEGDEIDYIAGGANEIFTLVVEEHFFHQYFFEYFGRPFEEMVGDKRLVIKEESADMLIMRLQHWLQYFHMKRESTLEKYYAMEEEILESLFSIIHTTTPKLHREKFDIRQIREILHKNIDNLYTIGDLVKEFKIPIRTMQYHFKQKFGISPKQYLHYLRLNTIRKELMCRGEDKLTISEIASKYGFFNASHFGSEYKKMFGETPGQTLQRYMQ